MTTSIFGSRSTDGRVRGEPRRRRGCRGVLVSRSAIATTSIGRPARVAISARCARSASRRRCRWYRSPEADSDGRRTLARCRCASGGAAGADFFLPPPEPCPRGFGASRREAVCLLGRPPWGQTWRALSPRGRCRTRDPMEPFDSARATSERALALERCAAVDGSPGAASSGSRSRSRSTWAAPAARARAARYRASVVLFGVYWLVETRLTSPAALRSVARFVGLTCPDRHAGRVRAHALALRVNYDVASAVLGVIYSRSSPWPPRSPPRPPAGSCSRP